MSVFVSAPVDARSLVFGVVPQQSASRVAEIWAPMIAHLAEASGLTLVFATAKDIPTFEACLARGAYDVAYMNPHHYVVFNERSGYRAFARQADRQLKGLIVVKKDSPARALEDLDHATLALPSPAAFGASVLTQAEMRSRGLRFTPRFLKSHDSVYRAVAAGLAEAGGGVARTFRNLSPELRDELRVLYETDAYTPHAFAALATVDQADVDALTQAMLAMAETAPAILSSSGFSGLQAAEDADWNDVRALGLVAEETDMVTGDTGACRSD